MNNIPSNNIAPSTSSANPASVENSPQSNKVSKLSKEIVLSSTATASSPLSSHTFTVQSGSTSITSKSTPKIDISTSTEERAKRLASLGLKLSPQQCLNLCKKIESNAISWISKAAEAAHGFYSTMIHVEKIPYKINVTDTGQIFISLKEELGRGASKIVSKAVKYDSAEIVAQALLSTSDPNDFTSISNEYNIMKQFREQEGIAQFYNVVYIPNPSPDSKNPQDAVKTNGFLMHFYEGGDLEHRINKEKKIQPPTDNKSEQTKIGSEETASLPNLERYREKIVDSITMLRGLCAMHRKGIVHNDIKPGNILQGKGTTVIADFGSASKPGKECLRGSMGYLAPEGFIRISAWSETDQQKLSILDMNLGPPKDVWAMGLTSLQYLYPNESFQFTPHHAMIKKELPEIHARLDKLPGTPAQKAIVATLKNMLTYDPSPGKRISAEAALRSFELILPLLDQEIAKAKLQEKVPQVSTAQAILPVSSLISKLEIILNRGGNIEVIPGILDQILTKKNELSSKEIKSLGSLQSHIEKLQKNDLLQKFLKLF